METKDILKKIREDNNLTQEEFAERVLVTRQARLSRTPRR